MIRNKFIYNKNDISGEIEDEFTGKEAVAVADFGADKTGKVEFKGTSWKAESKSEIVAGQKVIIQKKDNFKLIVEPKK
jgi:membrane protein implicated in regulation of membrane protease activity